MPGYSALGWLGLGASATNMGFVEVRTYRYVVLHGLVFDVALIWMAA